VPRLRPYQQRMIDDVFLGISQGKRGMCLQLPTGGGKTVVASDLVSQLSGRLLYIVPSDEILGQTAKMLTKSGVTHVTLNAKTKSVPLHYSTACVLAMSQTLQRRIDGPTFLKWSPDVIVFDEAHKLIDQHATVQKRWPKALRIGLTATPVRLDNKSLAGIFPVLICGPGIESLQRDGWLVPARPVRAYMPDLSNLRMLAGEYDSGQLGAIYSADETISAIVRAWFDTSQHRRTLVFTATVAASRALVAKFRRHGVRAEHLDGETPMDQRKSTLDALRKGSIDVVCNVGLFVEGLDLVETETVVLATKTASLSRYMQMVGRGLRPSEATGKKHLLVIDHGGNIAEHGDVDAPRDWFAGGAVARFNLCQDCNEPITGTDTRLKWCDHHARVRLAAAAISPMRQAQLDRDQSARTPPRPVPDWASQFAAQWERSEARRYANKWPLQCTEDEIRRLLSPS